MEHEKAKRVIALQELINLTAGSGLSYEKELIKSCADEIQVILLDESNK